MKPEPSPAFRTGFCQGCKRHDQRMSQIAPDRYRCDRCALHGEWILDEHLEKHPDSSSGKES